MRRRESQRADHDGTADSSSLVGEVADAKPQSTFATSLLAERGAKYGYTMSQIGHKSARLTLEVYTDADNRRDGANEQIGTLLRTPEWAQTGTNLLEASNGSDRLNGKAVESREETRETA
jgi:hypothetical protein